MNREELPKDQEDLLPIIGLYEAMRKLPKNKRKTIAKKIHPKLIEIRDLLVATYDKEQTK